MDSKDRKSSINNFFGEILFIDVNFDQHIFLLSETLNLKSRNLELFQIFNPV